MSTLVRFGLTFLVILLLIGMLALFNGRAGMQIIATGLSVVLILAVWLVSRMGNVQDLRSQNAPENVDRNAKKLIRIINKNFNSAGVEEIGSKTQQTIVETLKAVQSGQFKTEKQALNSFKCVPPAKFNEAKDTGSLARKSVV